MNHRTILLANLISTAVCCAQVDTPQDPAKRPSPEDAAKAVAAMFEAFEAQGLKVDPAAGTITIPTVVSRPDQPLEYLLIHRRGKAHEAMFMTEVKASVLNGAFLALGWAPGDNARVVDREPMPTREEVEAGAPIFDVFPPKGMPVWFTARWTRIDAEGNELEVELPVEDLLLDLSTEQTIASTEWVYLGGRMAPLNRNEPPVFVADYDGNYISIVYKTPSNHLVTMSHERAFDDQIWWVSDLMPMPGTEVELIVHRQRTKLHEERAERIAEREAKAAGEAAGEAADETGGDASGKPPASEERKG